MSVVISTEQVSKIYEVGSNEIVALDEVSLAIETGEFVALVGPSGSGKTTMLAVLAGLLTPTRGEVFIEQQNLAGMSEAELTAFRGRKMGFVFQASNLVPYLTALENVLLMLRLTGQLNKSTRQRACDLLTRLGLVDRFDNLPAQLSGGQQQRVAIARSLIHQPMVVLADEPTASLDTERAYQVVETFANLVHEQQRAGIMVTHDLRMCRYVDRVIHMRDGQVVQITQQDEAIRQLAQNAALG